MSRADVLAVMDRLCILATDKGAGGHEAREARAAVAEVYAQRDALAEMNERVAWLIEEAVKFIESNYPDARMLDRGPIVRNMRRWASGLRAALARVGGAA